VLSTHGGDEFSVVRMSLVRMPLQLEENPPLI